MNRVIDVSAVLVEIEELDEEILKLHAELSSKWKKRMSLCDAVRTLADIHVPKLNVGLLPVPTRVGLRFDILSIIGHHPDGLKVADIIDKLYVRPDGAAVKPPSVRTILSDLKRSGFLKQDELHRWKVA